MANTIKYIAKKTSASAYTQVPIGVDSVNVDRAGGKTVETSLTNIEDNIGNLTNLQTTSNTDLVTAINEVNAKPSVSTAEDVTYGESNVKIALDGHSSQLADITTIIYPTMNTSEIQEKLNAKGKFLFKKGVYTIELINTGRTLKTGIDIMSDTTIEFEDGTVITTPANDLTIFTIIGVYNQKNVKIIGGEIRGERAEHLGTTGEWGMGISIYSSENVTIDAVKCTNCWGDGIYITTVDEMQNKSIYINNVICDNNRRQGMSVESVDGFFVTNSQFDNTNGTNPQGGIDIEPYKTFHYINNVFIRDCIFKNNIGYGILIAKAGNIPTQSEDMNIKITDCNFYNNNFVVSNFKEGCGGEIVLTNCYFKNCRIMKNFTTYKFAKLTLNNITLVNPCYGKENGTEFDKSAILLYNVSSDERAVQDGTGNIEVNGLRIIEEEGQKIAIASIYLYDEVLNELYDIYLYNIKHYMPSGFTYSNRVFNSHLVKNLDFDASPFFNISPTSYTALLDKSTLASKIDNSKFTTGTFFVKLTNDYPLFKPIVITVSVPQLIVVEPNSETTTFGATNLRSNVVGNRLVIMKTSATDWVVVEKHGDWTTV